MAIEDKLLNFSVRIERFEPECENELEILGTGVLWEPDGTSEYIYVFTAGHVVLNRKDIRVRYIDKDQNEKYFEIDKDNVACHSCIEISEDKIALNDVAVLRCSRSSISNLNIHTYKLQSTENLNDNKDIVFRGFPDSLSQKSSFIFSNKPVNATLENAEKKLKRFTYRFNTSLGVNYYEANDQLTGFSGSGMFLDDNSSLALLGINSGSLGKNADLNTCVGMSSELILEICDHKGWDKPIMTSDIKGNLEDAAYNFQNEIYNDDLIEIMEGIISEDFSKVMRSNFCGISKECEYSSCPHECQVFRNQLLIIICILKYLNNSVKFEEASIRNGTQDIPVRFVCCDGEKKLSKVSLSNFIRSLKVDYLMERKLEEHSLILWGTKKKVNGKENYCTPKMFKNIIKDIKNSYIQDVGFDIKRGISQPKEIAIIEIDTLIAKIEDDTLEHMINLIKEVL